MNVYSTLEARNPKIAMYCTILLKQGSPCQHEHCGLALSEENVNDMKNELTIVKRS